jgi:tRNA (guanine-N(7)-)-methyltransferase subunit TRM82
MLRIWDWMTGKLRVEVEVWSTVQRFIKIQGVKKGRGWGDDADGGKERERKGEGIISQNEEGDVGDAEDHSGEMGPSVDNIAPAELQENFAESSGVVQVLHKIDSFHSGTGTYILFSAVGSVLSQFSLASF